MKVTLEPTTTWAVQPGGRLVGRLWQGTAGEPPAPFHSGPAPVRIFALVLTLAVDEKQPGARAVMAQLQEHLIEAAPEHVSMIAELGFLAAVEE